MYAFFFFLIIVSYFIDEVVSLTLRNRFVRVPLVASTSELSKLATKRVVTRVEEVSEQSVYISSTDESIITYHPRFEWAGSKFFVSLRLA